jgi:AcrR family transcriptional regulator
MSLRESWVDELFRRLTLRYGAAFLRQYEDIPLSDVKADWRDVLAGFDGESIGYALRYLPTERPPNVLQFRDICRRAPSPEQVPKLEAPKPDPNRVAQLLERMRKVQAKSDPQAMFDRLEAAKAAGTLSPGQADFLRRAKRGDLTTDMDFDGGLFNPIPPELWPWNKQQDAP